MTTLQENYYKWLFLLLSDIDEVKDEPFESRFKMEYECEDDELPVELIDYQEANNRLDGSVILIQMKRINNVYSKLQLRERKWTNRANSRGKIWKN